MIWFYNEQNKIQKNLYYTYFCYLQIKCMKKKYTYNSYIACIGIINAPILRLMGNKSTQLPI